MTLNNEKLQVNTDNEHDPSNVIISGIAYIVLLINFILFSIVCCSYFLTQ
ncbi:hypothetical protein GCM10011391_05980 [Pullulanibacillus camelliae]|uniref:Uncharacterized protein n=1 Tax=Pullulanibacillus camelliae TaxID=1707096 RepID=A0A8J2YF10_9BACL|nr:hypothetical protein [Pullulanibacillus camelliae]GGE30202.1 hypothetical protein GCM10011391_05980 [Pullulanibacillus camelliae]